MGVKDGTGMAMLMMAKVILWIRYQPYIELLSR
jgi:hypothetical protein